MKHCKICGLGEDYTNIRFNDDGVCNYCEFYEAHKDMLEDTEQLEQAFRQKMEHAGFLTLVNGIIWPRPQNCGFFYVKFIKI